jgi:SEC-C motif domain protein
MPRPERCPCQSGDSYAVCCGPLHSGEALAPTAERLMRARYSAFAVGDVGYLLSTWHPLTRPADFELDATLRWTRLDIERRENGGVFDRTGVVEFTAHCRRNGVRSVQHEVSRFERIDRRWYYLDAEA